MALAKLAPTISPPIRPGPALAATAARSAAESSAALPCARRTAGRWARCARAAISGTTPPNGACSLLRQHRLGQDPAVGIAAPPPRFRRRKTRSPEWGLKMARTDTING